jgi:hypothetical protein
MNGPTIRRLVKGSTRPTTKPPMSRSRLSMTRSITESIVKRLAQFVVIITGAWSLVPTSASTGQLAARAAIAGEARM